VGAFGLAVLVPDQPGAGERRRIAGLASRKATIRAMGWGFSCNLAGESLMKWMVWDLMRGIDMLLERPQIDPKRIVMLGAVAGGGDPAAVTAALDSRIAAVIPFNFGEAGPEEHYTQAHDPYDFETADPGMDPGNRLASPWQCSRSVFPMVHLRLGCTAAVLFSFEIGWPKTWKRSPHGRGTRRF